MSPAGHDEAAARFLWPFRVASAGSRNRSPAAHGNGSKRAQRNGYLTFPQSRPSLLLFVLLVQTSLGRVLLTIFDTVIREGSI